VIAYPSFGGASRVPALDDLDEMAICEFCLNLTKDGKCTVGLDIRKGMTCREFRPGMEKFCADPKDFVNGNQIVEMAMYFGLGRTELKKVKIMAARADNHQ
jgi:hypothetical protein